MSKHIERAWQGFKAAVVPVEASPRQVEDLRLAFFGGAAILFKALLAGVSDGDDITVDDARLMQDLEDELDEFGQQLDARYGSVFDPAKH